MDINSFRKFIFVNSQSCTYCIDKNDTVFAGILRNIGYKYVGKQSDDVIQQVENKYRNFITALNFTFALEVILYIYLFVFPLYTSIFALPFFIAIILLAVIPMVALYVTYLAFNCKYELFLQKNIGKYQLVQFRPNIYNVEPKAYDRYLKTSRKSVYGAILLMLIFVLYAFTPLYIDYLNYKQNYNSVVKISKIYLKLIPINSDIYAQKGYANYKLGNYNEAVTDYKMANKYSFSDSFDFEILGSNAKILSKSQMIDEFDRYIDEEKNVNIQDFLKSQKAVYLQQNNEYKAALKIYDELINAYEKEKRDGFVVKDVYYNRGVIKKALGDDNGAAIDKKKAKNMCSDCSFEAELTLVKLP